MARTSNKVQIYRVVHGDEVRLIRGSLRNVESLIRGEYLIEPATAEQAHELAEVEIEDAQGEP